MTLSYILCIYLGGGAIVAYIWIKSGRMDLLCQGVMHLTRQSTWYEQVLATGFDDNFVVNFVKVMLILQFLLLWPRMLLISAGRWW